MRRATIVLSCLAAALLAWRPKRPPSASPLSLASMLMIICRRKSKRAVNDAHALGEALTGLGYRSSAPTMPTAAVSTRIGRNS